MKRRVIVIVVVVAILAALGLGLQTYRRNAAEASRPVTRTTEVRYGELTLSISASGTVQSASSQNVYSMLSYTVDMIFVEEGQYVHRGDILAQLNTENLEFDIRQQKVALELAELNSGLDIDSRFNAYQDALSRSAMNTGNSRRSYELFASQVEDGVYPELISAQTAVDNAYDNLVSAELDLENKAKAYDDSEFLYYLGELSHQSLDISRTALEASQRALEVAGRIHDTALTNMQNLVERLNIEVETARRNYESTLLASQQEVGNAKRMYDNALASSSTESARINLERLEKHLRDAAITAPISGTITKVYASEGNPGNGLLFIIEDLQALEIVTKVKEYDVTNVQPGMNVIIRSDATGERNIQGMVKSIAPTSEKTGA